MIATTTIFGAVEMEKESNVLGKGALGVAVVVVVNKLSESHNQYVSIIVS